jgi:hypothetical protein
MRRWGWVQYRSSNLKNLSGTGVFAGSQHNCDKALSLTVPATLLARSDDRETKRYFCN